MRINESKDDGAELLIGLDELTTISLQEPTKQQWKNHLISFFDSFQVKILYFLIYFLIFRRVQVKLEEKKRNWREKWRR